MGSPQGCIEPHLASIYQDVISATHRPALALQSLHTAMAGAEIANLQPSFDKQGNTTKVSSITVIAPYYCIAC